MSWIILHCIYRSVCQCLPCLSFAFRLKFVQLSCFIWEIFSEMAYEYYIFLVLIGNNRFYYVSLDSLNRIKFLSHSLDVWVDDR